MLRERLIAHSGITAARLENVEKFASRMYKTYPIAKRTGGERLISQPTPELKAIQRWLAFSVFNPMQISGYATAYAKGASIRKNAERHKATRFTLHTDFENFFPSFDEAGLRRFLINRTKFEEQDVNFCAAIFLKDGKVTIGAPSSPILTNALMYDFDVKLGDWCQQRELVYSRYADDINVSAFAPDQVDEALDFIRTLAASYPYANLILNDAKTLNLSRKYSRRITGLVITPTGTISVGRERKRLVKHLIHQYSIGKLPRERVWSLSGTLAFIKDAEPEYLDNLRQKFGAGIVDELLRLTTPKTWSGVIAP